MRSLVVVATSDRGVNRFPKHSLVEALNLKDFLEQTAEFNHVSIYELENSEGPVSQWAELEQGSR